VINAPKRHKHCEHKKRMAAAAGGLRRRMWQTIASQSPPNSSRKLSGSGQ
jgi:hypothetical protein